MTYTLHHLAAGSYDLALDGVLVGSVVREITAKGTVRGWCAELFEDLPPETRPHPFAYVEHCFPTLDATTEWLGGAQIQSTDATLWSVVVAPGAVDSRR